MPASMVFPPSKWKQPVNTIDSIILEYNSTYPALNLAMWCESANGTNDWVGLDLPGPLSASGSYILHIEQLGFQSVINVYPTDCHFDLINAKNDTQKVNGNGFTLTTASASNVPETTFSRTGATSTGKNAPSTISAPSGAATSIMSSAGSLTGSTRPKSTSQSSDAPTGLSEGAKIGLGVGVGVGGALLIAFILWAFLLFRKRRHPKAAPDVAYDDNRKYEKAELMGNSLHPQYEMPGSGGITPSENGSKQHPDVGRQSQWGPPQELAGTAPYARADHVQSTGPVQRYELSS